MMFVGISGSLGWFVAAVYLNFKHSETGSSIPIFKIFHFFIFQNNYIFRFFELFFLLPQPVPCPVLFLFPLHGDPFRALERKDCGEKFSSPAANFIIVGQSYGVFN